MSNEFPVIFGNTWIGYFMGIAEAVSVKSKDPSTQVGAIIVGEDHQIVSTGYNGFPRGVIDRPRDSADPELRFQRPYKYHYTAHAEANAIFQAARHGIRTLGCHIVVSSMPPCAECAKAIIQAGIVAVYCYPADQNKPSYARWAESYVAADIMFTEAKVTVTYAGGAAR